MPQPKRKNDTKTTIPSANQREVQALSKFSSQKRLSKERSNKQQRTQMVKPVLVSTGVVLVLALLTWCATLYIHHQAAIKLEQQRFGTIQRLQQQFESNIRTRFSSSVTNMEEDDTCYYLAQPELQLFGQHGELNCGKDFQGAIYPPKNMSHSSENTAWDTALAVAQVAKMTIQQFGSPYVQYDTANRPLQDGSVEYSDSYGLDNQTIRCDVGIEMPYNPTNGHVARFQIRPGQEFFDLDCYQTASKMYFQFVKR